MNDLFNNLAFCIERGKVDRNSPYPPDLKGKDGAAEITARLLKDGVPPQAILEKALVVGMSRIGEKFARGEAFIPELLIAAKAMNAAMQQLKPYFDTGSAHHRGTVVIGTVQGDLHDIGKNIVRMVLEGDGWKAVDLGVNVSSEKFTSAVRENPKCIVAISALLTTTMRNMEAIVKSVKTASPHTAVYVGGAPLSLAYSDRIDADGYFPDPHSFIRHLSQTAR